ncbi:uncharacterized protein [Dendropsophus ebraccatus]|uniref:uncharacterized protein isoform X2 n=1 Tax=Dendropsophus ebraccatus TaxID=150705 RepID=UPI003831FF7C
MAASESDAGDPVSYCSRSARIKEEERQPSCTGRTAAEFPARSEAPGSCGSYRSVKEEAETQGDLVYNPDTRLWIKSIDETSLPTDDASEAKEPSQTAVHLHPEVSATAKPLKRRQKFTASEELVLVTELLEHYDKLFGSRARVTPLAQKVSIWQKILENVNCVGVLQRGIEEAKKHWHHYRHRLLEKLVAMQKPGPGAQHSLLARLTPLESKAANLFKLEYVLRSSPQPSAMPPVPGSQSGLDIGRDGRTESLYAQNGGGGGEQSGGGGGEQSGGGFSLAGDYTLSKAPRNIKFSFDENCALVHEAAGVWDSIIGRNAATTSQARKNFLWSRIVEAVNAAGTQPRSAENCKKRLRDIKRRVKAKMADQRKYSQHNGGGPCLELQYLSYEEELMHVMGPDTVRPIEGHVDTDRGPRLGNPPALLLASPPSSGSGHKTEVDMAEEEEDDDKEMVIKIEPINYSKDAPSPCPQSFRPAAAISQPCMASQHHVPAIPAKPLPACAKPPTGVTKPATLPTKPPGTSKPHPITTPSYSSLSAPSNPPNMASAGTINKVVGSLHTAQRHYHKSQRHQMHVVHMDLLHLGLGVQQLTRNVKVSNHIRSTERVRELRLKQKDIEDQRQYRMEKLCLLRQHHEAKLRIRQEHYDKKEKLLQENNSLLKGILQHLSHPAGTILKGEQSHMIVPPTYNHPSPPPQSSHRPPTHKVVRTRGGKGKDGT